MDENASRQGWQSRPTSFLGRIFGTSNLATLQRLHDGTLSVDDRAGPVGNRGGLSSDGQWRDEVEIQLQSLAAELDRQTAALAALEGRIAEKPGGATPPSPPVRAAWADDDWRSLERKGVFVIGSARSGTTIFANCLNISPQLYVLEEPDLFLQYAEPDFVEFFNARHRRYRNPPHKGCYVPPAFDGPETAFDFLHRMGNRYAYVGEKLAVGPRPNAFPDDWHRRCFAFYARYFYGAHFFMTLRRPGETAWSMHKEWPDAAPSSYLECWLASLDFMLDVNLAFERTYLSFFDRFSPATIAAAAQILDVTLDLPPGTIGPSYINSALAEGEMPDFLQPHAEVWRRCDEIYDLLRGNFSPETLRYFGAANRNLFMRKVKHSLAGLLADLGSIYTPAEIRIPAQ